MLVPSLASILGIRNIQKNFQSESHIYVLGIELIGMQGNVSSQGCSSDPGAIEHIREQWGSTALSNVSVGIFLCPILGFQVNGIRCYSQLQLRIHTCRSVILYLLKGQL